MISIVEIYVTEIARKYGGYREKSVMSKPHVIKRGETWDNDHKVIEVLESEAQEDGYRNGFQVDLVTRSICG